MTSTVLDRGTQQPVDDFVTRIEQPQRDKMARNMKVQNMAFFAVMALIVVGIAAIVHPPIAFAVVAPVMALTGFAFFKTEDARIAREIEEIEIAINELD